MNSNNSKKYDNISYFIIFCIIDEKISRKMNRLLVKNFNIISIN